MSSSDLTIKDMLKAKRVNIKEENIGYKNINKFNKDLVVICVREYVNHDGYDEYGPESDLIDLYLLVENKKSGKIFYQRWYGENWFDGSFSMNLEERSEVTKDTIERISNLFVEDNYY